MATHGYDDDDFVDQYDEDVQDDQEELSPEDKASMESGTLEVRRVLGSDANKLTAKQIQDALWHYYYDIDKSVAYLKKTFISPTPKPTPKKTPEGESRLFSFPATCGRVVGASGADHEFFERDWRLDGVLHFSSPAARFPILEKPGMPNQRIDFSDMPWLNVPEERQTLFIEPPRLPGGLLGGSEAAPKMSKLQALAAARKKKNDEKKEQDKTSQAERGIKRMSLADDLHKENSRPGSTQGKSAKISNEHKQVPRDAEPSATSFQASENPERASRMGLDGTSNARETSPATSSSTAASTEQSDEVFVTEKTAPSAFAQTLLGPAPEARRLLQQNTFAMPYTSSPSFVATAFSEPSPDDVVFAAQAKAGKKTPTSTPKAAKKTQKGDEASKKTDIGSGVSNLKIADVPPPKSLGLDVIKEFEKSTSKRSISFVVVGHVDAGKSTLMGRLLVELKFVEERTVEKYRRQAEKSGKQSFALAWVMDQRSEERDRGVTIDIATNHFETEKTKFTILDAPGHRDFVPNMIAGASQADFAILVIDANTGAYEKGLKGQTREHVLLLRSLGVQRLIVAVNKLDMVGWSQDRFDEISQQVTGFLTGLGFQSQHVKFIPISGLNGGNIANKVDEPAAAWYKGTTLIEALEASEPSTARALKKPFRMAISEVFRSQQGTTTLAGRIDSGTVQIGDVVLVQPSGETAYIKSIMMDTDSEQWAVAGQNVTIALTNIDPIHIRVGDIVCHVTDAIECGDTFTMKAMAFEHLIPMPVDLHRGRLHVAGQIQGISATLDKATGDIIKKKPKIVQPGAVARVIIKLGAKVPLESGQRVVIRSGGETIAAGLLE